MGHGRHTFVVNGESDIQRVGGGGTKKTQGNRWRYAIGLSHVRGVRLRYGKWMLIFGCLRSAFKRRLHRIGHMLEIAGGGGVSNSLGGFAVHDRSSMKFTHLGPGNAAVTPRGRPLDALDDFFLSWPNYSIELKSTA